MTVGKVENTTKKTSIEPNDCWNVWELQNVLRKFEQPTKREKKLNSSGMYIETYRGKRFVHY